MERAGFFGSQDTATFQMQVHGSGSPLASFLYRDIESARANGGGSATIGYQAGGAHGHDEQFSFNTAGSVSNGTIMSLVPEQACDPCDMNCDGRLDAFDIEPFLDLLFGPNPDPCDTCTGDVNGDGVVDAFDIEPFLNCLFP